MARLKSCPDTKQSSRSGKKDIPQGLKSLRENSDLQLQPRRGDLKVRPVQISVLTGGGKPARLRLGFSKKPISNRRSFPP